MRCRTFVPFFPIVTSVDKFQQQFSIFSDPTIYFHSSSRASLTLRESQFYVPLNLTMTSGEFLFCFASIKKIIPHLAETSKKSGILLFRNIFLVTWRCKLLRSSLQFSVSTDSLHTECFHCACSRSQVNSFSDRLAIMPPT